MKKKQYCIYVYGPTAVGKSELVEQLAREISAEIINADMGQLYVPLTIGTAKPAWRESTITHHLYDVVSDPRHVTVVEYRAWLLEKIQEIWQRGHVPIVVGGSSFYMRSVFWPPRTKENAVSGPLDNEISWDRLHAIDPVRAAAIAKTDRYRIARALSLWRSTGVKPSELMPLYDPPTDYLMICLMRERSDLYTRINERVVQMLQAGWIDEVKKLMGTPWQQYLEEKKIIGYDDIIAYLKKGDESAAAYDVLVAAIQKRTRNYAKRQMSFWRMMARELAREIYAEKLKHRGIIQEIELTNISPREYSKRIQNELKSIDSWE